MSTQVTQSQSQTLNDLSRGNGQVNTQPPTTTKYVLEDFSQQAINRGQVEINYLLTIVNARIADALREFKTAVWQLGHCGQVDFNALEKAIKAVDDANKKVAGPFPPGCAPGGTPN